MANEKRLIDANKIQYHKSGFPKGEGFDSDRGLDWAFREDIDKLPTVDAVEVVHGRWVQIGYDKAMDRITCSCCLEYWNIADNDTESFNYCPNCGAKMDGGNESG